MILCLQSQAWILMHNDYAKWLCMYQDYKLTPNLFDCSARNRTHLFKYLCIIIIFRTKLSCVSYESSKKHASLIFLAKCQRNVSISQIWGEKWNDTWTLVASCRTTRWYRSSARRSNHWRIGIGCWTVSEGRNWLARKRATASFTTAMSSSAVNSAIGEFINVNETIILASAQDSRGRWRRRSDCSGCARSISCWTSWCRHPSYWTASAADGSTCPAAGSTISASMIHKCRYKSRLLRFERRDVLFWYYWLMLSIIVKILLFFRFRNTA